MQAESLNQIHLDFIQARLINEVVAYSVTGQIAQVVRRSLLVREVWDSNPELIKSPTCCQRLAIVATLIVWALAQSRGDEHRSLMTPGRVLSQYNENLIFAT